MTIQQIAYRGRQRASELRYGTIRVIEHTERMGMMVPSRGTFIRLMRRCKLSIRPCIAHGGMHSKNVFPPHEYIKCERGVLARREFEERCAGCFISDYTSNE